MNLSEELAWRGFVNQTTYPDLSVIDNQKITFYHGFDASADSQTVGNLAGMMLDRLFLKHGHRGVILAGGATSLIGDPGGKGSERPLQDEAAIAHNIEKAKDQLNRILKGYDYTMVNNLDWTKDMSIITFLRDYGKHFSMTPILQRDYIARRIGEGGDGISYAELSYTILQGMDYLHLFDNEGVTLQLGGSDQWGNILSGVDLIRRTRSAEVHAMTLPLIINKATGKKFGKSEEGAVWLDGAKTSPFDFYQFWLNTEDEAVEEYLKIFTEIDKEQIERLMLEFNNDRAGRLAQRTLAREVTKLVHGDEEVAKIESAAGAAYGDQPITPESLPALKEQLPHAQAKAGATTVVESLVATGLASSNSEARRMISDGGVYLNGERLSDTNAVFNSSNIIHGHAMLARGKTKAIIELAE
jgi:tyrosyl-tRNA synthetase